jgi:hypothetical protein
VGPLSASADARNVLFSCVLCLATDFDTQLMNRKYQTSRRIISSAARISASLIPAALLLFSLNACSRPTQMVSTWHEQSGSAHPYTRILVVGVSESSGQRRRFENTMKAVLEQAGNTAWASHRLMPSDEPLKRDSVEKIVESTGAEAVAVTRLANHEVTGKEVELKTGAGTKPAQRKATDFFQYDYNVQYDHNVDQQAFRDDNDVYEKAGYVVMESTVTLSTDIYETSQGNLVYTVETTTYEKESEYEIVNEATRAIARRLKTDGLIR